MSPILWTTSIIGGANGSEGNCRSWDCVGDDDSWGRGGRFCNDILPTKQIVMCYVTNVFIIICSKFNNLKFIK